MTYISLYRKYRPKSFDEIVGQEIVVKILKNSIKNNKISHAYIFAGPRGVGKTSLAKIFAKTVNCLNNTDGNMCGKCQVCLNNYQNEIDIIEIDAASNNGVDEIREIRNNVKLMPSNLKYKVYIIDEVHMLSTSAFNALLKTLEEPPAHVIFILATTEVNKIPATVISRCQKFDFEKITSSDIEFQLKRILNSEGKVINNDVINLIAKLSDGGMRDAINLLDQVISLNSENVTQEDVYNIIGDVNDQIIEEITNYVINSNIKELLKIVEKLSEKGKNFLLVCDKLQILFTNILIYKNTKKFFEDKYEKILDKYCILDNDKYIKIIDELFKLSQNLLKTNNQRILLEVCFIKLSIITSEQNNTQNKNNSEKKINIETDNNCDEINKIRINNALYGANKALKEKFINKLYLLDEYISSKNYNSVANLLKKSSVEVVSDLEIIFSFSKSFDVVLFNKNILDIEKLLKNIYNIKYKVVAISKENWNKIKEEYIINKKNGVEYKYIDENFKKNNTNTKIEKKLDDIFGEECVTIN